MLFNKDKYFSVTEFAKKVGVSSKEIYLRLENKDDELNKYVKTQVSSGSKLINEKATRLY